MSYTVHTQETAPEASRTTLGKAQAGYGFVPNLLGVMAEAFFEAGYAYQQVLEVILGVTIKTLSNYVNHQADTPLDSAFQAGAWELKAA